MSRITITALAAVAAGVLLAPSASSAQGQYGGQYGGQSRVAPRGDYARSCSGAYTNQGRLYADCTDRQRNVRGSSIELNRCNDSDIRNDDGLLVCGNVRGRWEGNGAGGGNGGRNGGGWGGGNGGGWNGGDSDSITVYQDANYGGQSITLRGDTSNLNSSGFNDQISSMRFRGSWEACTDAYFQGQCQTFNDDVRNLSDWGMNDRISSLRPARRR